MRGWRTRRDVDGAGGVSLNDASGAVTCSDFLDASSSRVGVVVCDRSETERRDHHGGIADDYNRVTSAPLTYAVCR
jgi:hypothetical protein